MRIADGKDFTVYTSGELDKSDPSNNTIIWHDFDQTWIRPKRKHLWSPHDLNHRCVFFRWNGTKFFFATNQCFATVVGRVYCQYAKGESNLKSIFHKGL